MSNACARAPVFSCDAHFPLSPHLGFLQRVLPPWACTVMGQSPQHYLVFTSENAAYCCCGHAQEQNLRFCWLSFFFKAWHERMKTGMRFSYSYDGKTTVGQSRKELVVKPFCNRRPNVNNRSPGTCVYVGGWLDCQWHLPQPFIAL